MLISSPSRASVADPLTRPGIEVFQRFFERNVDLCQEPDPVWGQELDCTAIRVRVDADTDSLVPRVCHEARVPEWPS